MKIKKNSENKKLLITASLLILVVTLICSVYIFIYKQNLPEDKQHSSDKEQSKNLQSNSKNKGISPNADHPPAPTPAPGSSKKQVQMTASSDRQGDTIFIRGGINYPVTGGTCYVQLTGPSGQSIRKDSAILQNPASTDCKTISISVNDLTPGKWSFNLRYTSNEYEGSSREVSFTL